MPPKSGLPRQTRPERMEASDDVPVNPRIGQPDTATIGDVITARFSRRTVLGGLLGTAAAAALPETILPLAAAADTPPAPDVPGFNFPEAKAGVDRTHHVAEGYQADILLRWGDPLFADAPQFDPHNQSAARQLQQFGYNNDYIGHWKLNFDGTRLLLCVNHEYTNEDIMLPEHLRTALATGNASGRAACEIEMAAHGGSVVELELKEGKWQVNRASRYNRRITPLTTRMTVTGPAAGHPRLQTTGDPEGTSVTGTLNNCAGGITPWGTWLMAEENFRYYFHSNRPDPGGAQAASFRRYGLTGKGYYDWWRYYSRFDLDAEPNEANRFGWIVEVDLLNPAAPPRKHTALGRFAHEGAETVLNMDGSVVVFSGDDSRFEYIYRFIASKKFTLGPRTPNLDILTDGSLFVARFNEDGTLDWLPLRHGEGPLTAENGFHSQADVLIDTRRAADLVGATPMDRPEDVEANRKTGKVYAMLTNNTRRTDDQRDAANPRARNAFGHIIEMIPPDGEYTAPRYRWELLVKCGDPAIAEVGAQWNPAISDAGWFACPDNCTFDADGRLWVATDQGDQWHKTGKADGLYGIGTDGKQRGLSRLFFRCPVGAELCGPCFTDDQKHLFLSVQHPAADGVKQFAGFNRASTFEDPATRWPDFKPDSPPRPAVVVIRKQDGGKIG